MLFGAVYLLLHGAVKVVLVIALLLNKLWAYPCMIVVLLIFIGYQLYRIALNPSAGLIGAYCLRHADRATDGGNIAASGGSARALHPTPRGRKVVERVRKPDTARQASTDLASPNGVGAVGRSWSPWRVVVGFGG